MMLATTKTNDDGDENGDGISRRQLVTLHKNKVQFVCFIVCFIELLMRFLYSSKSLGRELKLNFYLMIRNDNRDVIHIFNILYYLVLMYLLF